jgi:hypothetical protein
MAYTVLPPGPQRADMRFDLNQFADRRHSWNMAEVGLDYAGLEKCSIKRITDLRKGRRNPVPDWAYSNTGLQEALCKYLEARFHLKPSGDIATRLERCREAAKKCAQPTKVLLERGMRKYMALVKQEFHELPFETYKKVFCNRLRGKTDEELIARQGRQVSVWDTEVYTIEKAPELVLSIMYQSLRRGLDSPTIGESLNLAAPAVRQILSRCAKRAVRKTDTRPTGRPKKVKP